MTSLKKILNLKQKTSIKQSHLPSILKSAHIIMIPKEGDPSDMNNFRPINITPVLMRLLEKVILLRIQEFNQKNKVIVKEQSGFRRKSGTKEELVGDKSAKNSGFNS